MFAHLLSICNKHGILDSASFSLLETFLFRMLSVCWVLTVLASLTLGRPPCVGVPCWVLTVLASLTLGRPPCVGVRCWGLTVLASLTLGRPPCVGVRYWRLCWRL